MFRTRQAPSPTGYLHIGTARTVLFTKLLAKINNGIFYLRIEDTDRSRLQQDTVKVLLRALDKIGLNADEGVTLNINGEKDGFYGIYQEGRFGPYIQSERKEIYHTHAQKLIDKRLAYWNYLSADEKTEIQELKNILKQPIDYFKICKEKYGEEKMFISVSEGLSSEQKPLLMYRIKREQKIICPDLLLGKTEFDLNLEEDFGIMKSDGFPSYHLAHLVDDKLMETSLVVRGQEWYSSLPKHITMFKDYWESCPDYIHLPSILAETGNKKMSKRDGNVNLQDYLDKGYLPEAILNYIAFLGWNPGTEKELYLDRIDFQDITQPKRLEKLLQNISVDFNIDRLSKSPARFNTEKLNWFNKQYINYLSIFEFDKISSSELNSLVKDTNQLQYFLSVKLDQNRAILTTQVGVESNSVLRWEKPGTDILIWKNSSTQDIKINLDSSLQFITNKWGEALFLRERLEKIFSQTQLDKSNEVKFNESLQELNLFWETSFKNWILDNSFQTGNILWPLRVSLSGQKKSPSPFELISILDIQEIKKRINEVIESL